MCDNESAPLVISAHGRIAAGSLRGEGYRLEQQPNDSSSVLASQHYQPSTHFCDTFPKLVLRGEAWGVAAVCFRTCSTGKIKLILSNLYWVNLLSFLHFQTCQYTGSVVPTCFHVLFACWMEMFKNVT
jgi:hypothetical protein